MDGDCITPLRSCLGQATLISLELGFLAVKQKTKQTKKPLLLSPKDCVNFSA